jgi:tRNA-modifying protein YgfZ
MGMGVRICALRAPGPSGTGQNGIGPSGIGPKRHHHFVLLSVPSPAPSIGHTRPNEARGARRPARLVSISARARARPYASPMDIVEALRSGATYVRLDRLVARVTGEDPIAFLDATTTQDLSGLKPEQSALTCMLDEKGRVLAELRATALSDGTVLIDAEQATRDAITGWLAKIAPLSGCEVVDETSRWTVIAVRGARAAEQIPSDAIAIEVDWGLSGYDIIADAPLEIDAVSMSETDYDAARIAAGRPRFGVDFDETTHIAETPLIARAVSFMKGCYPGQESVARVQNLGRVRKRLVGLEIEGAEVPPVGTTLTAESSEVGHVTSAAMWGASVAAIGFVRSDVHDGAIVAAGSFAAEVRAL